MSTLQFIDDFWRAMCPFFKDYDLFYLIMDSITIIEFIRLMFALPKRLLRLGGRR